MWVTEAMLVFIFLACCGVRINVHFAIYKPRSTQNLSKIAAYVKIPAEFCLFLQKNDYICTRNVVFMRA